MIVLGNPSFATGMKLAGIKNSYTINTQKKAEEILAQLPKDELVVANTSVIELAPILKEYENLVTIPDDPEQFGSVSDLKDIVKSAIGFELKLE